MSMSCTRTGNHVSGREPKSESLALRRQANGIGRRVTHCISQRLPRAPPSSGIPGPSPLGERYWEARHTLYLPTPHRAPTSSGIPGPSPSGEGYSEARHTLLNHNAFPERRPHPETLAVRRRRTVFRGASHTVNHNAFPERRPHPESVAVRRQANGIGRRVTHCISQRLTERRRHPESVAVRRQANGIGRRVTHCISQRLTERRRHPPRVCISRCGSTFSSST